MKRHLKICTILLCMGMALSGCSSNPATGKHSFTGFMSPEKEIAVGTKEHPKMVKQFGGIYPDKTVSKFVRDLGLSLAKSSEKPNLPWTFTVLNDSIVNAFALPGGYVYVTRGLLALASDKAELAGVLSHEIGHVTARHTAQRYSSTVAANIGVNVIGVLSQVAGLGRVGGDLASLGANVALKSYSRDQEFESDKLGVRYMTRLGYDPQAMVSFFEKLKKNQIIEAENAGRDVGSVDKTGIFATHPRTADRIEQAIELTKSKNKKIGKRDAKDYLDHIDGLAFGDEASQGLVRGNMFIHPEMGVRFEVPDGFEIKNTPTAVVATDKSGAEIRFFGAPTKDVNAAGGMERYFVYKWGSGMDMSNMEKIDINGMRAITAETTIWTGLSNTIFRRVIVEKDKNTYWRLEFKIPPNENTRLRDLLRRTTYSLRSPTDDELRKNSGWHVRVVKVGAGVTYDNLVNSMAVSNHKSEWFQALNNLTSTDSLTSGMMVKVIK